MSKDLSTSHSVNGIFTTIKLCNSARHRNAIGKPSECECNANRIATATEMRKCESKCEPNTSGNASGNANLIPAIMRI